MQTIEQIDLGGVNAYLVKNEEKFMLVDTGGHMFMDKEYTDRCQLLIQEMEKQGVRKGNLAMIFLTHGDNDHVCNARAVKEQFDAPIAMNEKDVYMVEHPNYLVYKDNSQYESAMFRLVFHFMDKKIDKLMQKVYADFRTFTPDILFSEGDTLASYGFDGTIYELPGHTDGSIGILDSSGNLLCGDLFANNKKPALAMNAKSFSILRQSAERVSTLPVVRIYPGHGAPYTIEK